MQQTEVTLQPTSKNISAHGGGAQFDRGKVRVARVM